MQKKTNSFPIIASLLVLSTLVSACAKHVSTGQQNFNNDTMTKQEAPAAEAVVLELAPTFSDEKLGATKAQYEERAKKIETPQAILHLEKIKMSKVVMRYDPKERKFFVNGHAAVLDENKNEIATSEFILSAVHAADDGKFKLIDVSGIKKNSDTTPVVRASVTCLSARDDDSIDCSSAVVDFFVAYKKTLYTEQMESTAPKAAVIPEAPKTTASPSVTEDAAALPAKPKADQSVKAPILPEKIDGGDGTELQSEKEEASVLGRFEGQVETADLKEQFDADDEIQSVIKEKIKIQKPGSAMTSSASPKTDASVKKADGKNSAVKPAPQIPQTLIKQETKAEVSSAGAPQMIPINNNAAQTAKGIIRPINQALGYPNKGNLRNATSVLEKQKSGKTFFEIAFPERQRYFSTYEMGEMISRLGEKINSTFNRKLEVSDISKQRGGNLSPHLSHQIGMDADIGYPATIANVKFPVVVKMSTRQYNPSSFSIAKTYELLKYAYSQNDLKVDRIFADRKIKQVLCEYARSKGETTGKDKDLVQSLFKNIEHVDGHGDHFHIRMRCTSAHPACRNKVYVQVGGC